MKKILLLTITAGALCLLSGCCLGGYSNMTGCMLTINEQVTVAHLSSVKDNVVWEADGNCYIQTPVSVYKLNKNVLNTVGNKDYFLLDEKETDFTRIHWVQIQPEVKDFLCAENNVFSWNNESGKLLTDAPDISKAKKHAVKRSRKSLFAYRGWNIEDIPQPNVKLQTKESGVRYYLIPAALVTFPMDIVVTITMNCPIVGLFYMPFFDDRKQIKEEQSPQIQEERRRREQELVEQVFEGFSKNMPVVL